MSDISVTLDQPNYTVNLGGNVDVTLGGAAISANLGAQNLSVNLGGNVTVNFPMGIQFNMDAWIAAVDEYDNDADALAASETYYKASASHESAYKGTFIIL